MAHRVLDVRLGGDLVGKLEQDAWGSVRFAYEGGWLNSPEARSLSASLPLRPGRFTPKATRPFFAGLLPEEESRRLVAGVFGISARNDFALLERIGGECAGAVSLWPEGGSQDIPQPTYRELSEEGLKTLLEDVEHRPLLVGELGARLSLAGAQKKLALRIRDGRYFLPIEGAPSTHIIKPRSSHFTGLVENEFFCMRLAAVAGLGVPQVGMSEAGGIPFLWIERFDRRAGCGENPERIHQEDFCQVLGIVPEMKYQQEGGPNLRTCFKLVREISSIPGPDLLRFFDAVVFNYLIGNCDAHGKNFSLLYGKNGACLAPFYDLICTAAYPKLSTAMAMKIGGEREWARIGGGHWSKFFREVDMGESLAKQRLVSTTERIISEAEVLDAQGCPGSQSVLPLLKDSSRKILNRKD